MNPKLKLLFKPRNLPLTLSLLIVILAIPLTVGLALSKTLYNLTSSAHQLRQATKPVCNIRIINKKPSDGWWRWLDEKREVKHKYEKGCKKNNCQALCKNAGTKSEGWYSSCTNKLIVFAKCGEPYPSATPPPPPCNPPNYIDIKLSEANNGSTITASVGQIISLSLEELGSAGYQWQLSIDKKYLNPLCERTIGSKCGSQPEEKCIGGPVSRWSWYEVIKSGQTSITGVYCHPWDCQNTTQKKLNINLQIRPSPESKCIDSDGGVNPFVKGVCTDNRGFVVGDGCLRKDGSGPVSDGTYVTEAFCLTEEMINYCKKNIGRPDAEKYCENLPRECYSVSLMPDPNLAWTYFSRNTKYFCPYGCKDGACLSSPPPPTPFSTSIPIPGTPAPEL